MNWLPSFLNIWTAAAAAAIVIPALLILYFLKLRRREMPVSSTLLWKKAIQDLQVNAPFQRLRRNLLLLLQLLLLALLLLALARPVANYAPGAGQMTVVLIDRSASMGATDVNGNTRLDEAKRRAKDLVETLDRNASAMVIAFDDKAEIVRGMTSDVPALKAAIDSVQQTDRRSSLRLAYQLAEAQANINPDQLRALQRPDVWVFSDGRVSDADDLSITAQVHYDKIGTDQAPNVAIVAMSAKRNYERPTEVQVFARLANYGPNLIKPDVQLSVDGRVRAVAGTTLHPERWTEAEREAADAAGTANRNSVEFTVELPEAAVVRVEQTAREGDALSADDAAQVVVPPPRPLNVLVVTDGQNYFLDKAIDAMGLDEPRRITPRQYEAAVPTEYDVILFDRYAPKALPPAGNFISFGAVPPALEVKPVQENGVNQLATDVGVLDWKRDHPMLKYLLLEKIYVAESLRLQVPPRSEVLVEGTQGPLVVLHREGPSLHLILSFDLLQSNWPVNQPSFPLFMYNALQFMAIGSDMDVRQAFAPGDTPVIPRAAIQKAGETPRALVVSGPGGTREVPVPEVGGDVALPPLNHVGVYTIDPPIPQYEKLAVNLLDANESDLTPAEVPPGGVGEAVASGAGEARLELWWWIVACAALPLLLIEWWVYTRRVHL